MADELTLEDPIDSPGAEPVAEKPWYMSHSMWAAIFSGLLGFLTLLKVPQEITTFIGANYESAIGAVLTLVGVYGAWAAATRKTTLTTGRK
jgi:hypothetical protein